MSNAHIEFQSAMNDFKIMFPDMVNKLSLMLLCAVIDVANLFVLMMKINLGLGCNRRNSAMQ